MAVWRSLVQLFGLGNEPDRHASLRSDTGELQELQAGQIVGEYVVEQKLGEGGFGAVYRAVHPVIGKAAAVKVLHPQYSTNFDVVSRFVSEARSVNQIRHRHIIDIFSFGSLEDGRHYYVMELLEGVPLDEYLEHMGRLEPREALPILQAVAKALEAAHDAGIAHRDLKPENIFLSVDDDGTVFPKLLDFGVAKLLTSEGPGPMHKTHTGTPIGSPRYMSPEQCQGKNVDHRTDIYAFGVIAHRMFTGKLPFEANTALELMLMHVGTEPPRVSEEVEELGVALDEPVLRMLQKDPGDRPASLSEAFAALLEAAESMGVEQDSMHIVIPFDVREAIHQARAASRRSDRMTPSGVQTPARRGGAVPTTPAPVGNTNARILLAAVVTIALVGGITFFLSSPPAEPISVAVTASAATPTSSAAEPRVNVLASSNPRTARSSVPSPPASVSWIFETQPQDADVFLGDEPLGKAPGPFFVSRTNDKRVVTVRAPGFQDEEIELDGRTDRVVSVQLKRRAHRLPQPPDVPEDLEYPF